MGHHSLSPSAKALGGRKTIRTRFLSLTRLPAAAVPKEEVVHRLRVTGKRLRAFLQLFSHDLEKEEVHTWKQKITQACRPLAAARNSTVLRKLGKKLKIEPLLQLSNTGNPGSAEIKKAVSTLRGAKTYLLHEALPVSRKESIRKELKKSVKLVFTRGKKSGHSVSGVLPHQWRKSIKQLFYQLELEEAALGKSFQKKMKRLAKMEDRLGKIHDADELKAALKDLPQAQTKKQIFRRIHRRQKRHAHAVEKMLKDL